jgi:hypothetical protein
MRERSADAPALNTWSAVVKNAGSQTAPKARYFSPFSPVATSTVKVLELVRDLISWAY